MSGVERVEFEAGLRAGRRAGARGRRWLGMYELWPLPVGVGFPPGVEVWLGAHGFVRREDPIRGPFWERPADEEVMEVA